MAAYLITMKFFLDEEPNDDPAYHKQLKGWIEEALDGGAMGATVLSITTTPEEEE